MSRGWEEGVGGVVGGVQSESQTHQATKSMEFTRWRRNQGRMTSAESELLKDEIGECWRSCPGAEGHEEGLTFCPGQCHIDSNVFHSIHEHEPVK